MAPVLSRHRASDHGAHQEGNLPIKRNAGDGPEKKNTKTLSLHEVERRHILETLRKCRNDKVRAAAALGIDLSTLYRKLKRYGQIP
ncbi:MAG: helix-turn-helix domain-containing protein [Blastocatellia bacterium]